MKTFPIKRPKVSVCVVTYNQINTIEKCLQSILEQDVDFEFEVIVGDDCSSDGTRLIVESFMLKYPRQVRVIFHEKNQGPAKNLIKVHAAAIGEYVAHIDGDDYAKPGKLAKQVHYLDSELDCIAVVHRLALIDQGGILLNKSWPSQFLEKKIGITALARNHPIFGHSSLMYRGGAYAEILGNLNLPEIVDFFLYIHLASQGMIGTINETLGEYTVGVGMSTKKNLYELVQQALTYASALGLPHYDYRFASARQFLIFAEKALNDGDLLLFKCLINESVRTQHISLRQLLLFILGKNETSLKLGERGYRWLKQRLPP